MPGSTTLVDPVVYTASDGAGTVWEGAAVQVNVHGGSAASIFADPGLSRSVANPLHADAAGVVRFYVAPGDYDLVATSEQGASRTDYVTVAAPTDVSAISESKITGLTGDLAAKAPLASPALTGTPTAPTAGALDNTTKVATTAYADAAVAVEKTRAQTAEGLAVQRTGDTMTGALGLGGNQLTGAAVEQVLADAAALESLPYVPVRGVYNTSKIVDTLALQTSTTTGNTSTTVVNLKVNNAATRTGYQPGDILHVKGATNKLICQVASTQTAILPGATGPFTVAVKALGAADGTAATTTGNINSGTTVYNCTQGDFAAAYVRAENLARILYPNGAMLRVTETGNCATMSQVAPALGYYIGGVGLCPDGYASGTTVAADGTQGPGTWLIEMPGQNAPGSSITQMLPVSAAATLASPLSTAAAVTSVSVTFAAAVTIPRNTVLRLAMGWTRQQVVTSAAVKVTGAGTVTVPVYSFLPAAAFDTTTTVATPTGWSQVGFLSAALNHTTGFTSYTPDSVTVGAASGANTPITFTWNAGIPAPWGGVLNAAQVAALATIMTQGSSCFPIKINGGTWTGVTPATNQFVGAAAGDAVTATTITVNVSAAVTGNTGVPTVTLPFATLAVAALGSPYETGDHMTVGTRPVPTQIDTVVPMIAMTGAAVGATAINVCIAGNGSVAAKFPASDIPAGWLVQNLWSGAAVLNCRLDITGTDGINVAAANAGRAVLSQGYKLQHHMFQYAGGYAASWDSNPFSPYSLGGNACNQLHFSKAYVSGGSDSASIALSANGFDWEGDILVTQSGTKYWNCGGLLLGEDHHTGGIPNQFFFQPCNVGIAYFDSCPAVSFAHTINASQPTTATASDVTIASGRFFQNTKNTSVPCVWNTLNDPNAFQVLSIQDPTATFTLTVGGQTTTTLGPAPTAAQITSALVALSSVGTVTRSAAVINNVYVVQRAFGVFEIFYTGNLSRTVAQAVTVTGVTGTAPVVIPVATLTPTGGVSIGNMIVTISGGGGIFTSLIENPTQYDYVSGGIVAGHNCLNTPLYAQIATGAGGTNRTAPGAELPVLVDGVSYWSGGAGAPWSAGGTKTYRRGYTFNIPATVAAGTLGPIFLDLGTGQTAKIVSARYICAAGTATVAVNQNGSAVSSLGTLAVTTTAGNTAAGTPPAVAAGDQITAVISSPSGCSGLAVTVFVEDTV